MSANALISSAFPDGSRKNIVACSPGSPRKRTCGSMRKWTPAARKKSYSDGRLSLEATRLIAFARGSRLATGDWITNRTANRESRIAFRLVLSD